MKTEYKIFSGVAGFLFVAAIVYGTYTRGTGTHVEWVGTVALILSGLLCSMCGGFFWFVSRRIDARPEDRKDAEIADGAGELGFFSPASYWPFGLAVGAAITGLALAFWYTWLLAIGVVWLLVTIGGLLFEYYSGTRQTAEH